MDIQQYLQRINYAGPISMTHEVLADLQNSHLLSVPFENLDIHNNTKIDLANLFDKIVVRRRGGFCYELNGLFYELLMQLGFTAKIVSARVYNDKDGYGEEFDHMALVVKIDDDDYLVDVGFGEFAFHPIKIAPNQETTDPRGVFKIEPFNGDYTIVKKRNADGTFVPEYMFSETARDLAEFNGMCLYHQTSPESHFTQKRICSLPTNDGRVTLTGNTVKIKENGIVKEHHLENEEQVKTALWEYFGIKL